MNNDNVLHPDPVKPLSENAFIGLSNLPNLLKLSELWDGGSPLQFYEDVH